MKKYYFALLASSLFFSCSNDNDVVEETKLVKGTIGLSSEVVTRTYLGMVSNDNSKIAMPFREGETMAIDDEGNPNGQFYTFTCDPITGSNQSVTFSGYWTDNNINRRLRIITPRSAAKSISWADGYASYSLNLKDNQTTEALKSPDNDNVIVGVSNDEDCCLAISYAASKGPAMWVYPVVSYLYFSSYEPSVTISSSDKAIAGQLDAVYKNSITLDSKLKGDNGVKISTAQATGKTITAHGVNNVTRNGVVYVNRYEYVVVILPGTYPKGTLTIGGVSNKGADAVFEAGKTYFLGDVSTAKKGTASANNGGAEIDVPWVQLWKGGPRWATFNVGATSVNESGTIYSWGAVSKPHIENSMLKGSCSSSTNSIQGTDDDTASNLWGHNWQMPTKEDFDNLLKNCDITYVDGNYVITGKDEYKDCSIVLHSESPMTTSSNIPTGAAFYWSASPGGAEDAYCFRMAIHERLGSWNISPGTETFDKIYGLSVRPILR